MYSVRVFALFTAFILAIAIGACNKSGGNHSAYITGDSDDGGGAKHETHTEHASRFTLSTPNCDEDSGPCAESVVTDSETGLVWEYDYATDKDWQQAKDYCEALVYAGYDDWRLPTMEELRTLVNKNLSGPASDFPDIPATRFWSSTTCDEYPANAWGVNFYLGDEFNYYKTTAYYARCVRGAMKSK